MEKRQLGNTNPNITSIGFGGWPTAEKKRFHGRKPEGDDRTAAPLKPVVILGAKRIDTTGRYAFGYSAKRIAERNASFQEPRTRLTPELTGQPNKPLRNTDELPVKP